MAACECCRVKVGASLERHLAQKPSCARFYAGEHSGSDDEHPRPARRARTALAATASSSTRNPNVATSPAVCCRNARLTLHAACIRRQPGGGLPTANGEEEQQHPQQPQHPHLGRASPRERGSPRDEQPLGSLHSRPTVRLSAAALSSGALHSASRREGYASGSEIDDNDGAATSQVAARQRLSELATPEELVLLEVSKRLPLSLLNRLLKAVTDEGWDPLRCRFKNAT